MDFDCSGRVGSTVHSKSFFGFWLAWARDPFLYNGGDVQNSRIAEGFAAETGEVPIIDFNRESLMHLGCFLPTDQSITMDKVEDSGAKIMSDTLVRLVQFIDGQ